VRQQKVFFFSKIEENISEMRVKIVRLCRFFFSKKKLKCKMQNENNRKNKTKIFIIFYFTFYYLLTLNFMFYKKYT